MSTPISRAMAAAEWVRPCGNDASPPNEQYVSLEFALLQETELQQAQAALAALEEDASKLREQMDVNIEDFLNEKACCNGDECGCGGVTRLQQYVQEEAGTELGSLRAALAAVTLEWEGAKAIARNLKLFIGEQKTEHEAQLADCQSREAKALEELERTKYELNYLRNHRNERQAEAEADRDQLQAQVGALQEEIAGLQEAGRRAIAAMDQDHQTLSALIQKIDALRGELFDLASNYYTHPDAWPESLQAALAHQPAPAAPDSAKEPTYPCEKCGTLRTKAQGGTTFTLCDRCWDDTHHTP